jgi:arsenical pump membrane protein
MRPPTRRPSKALWAQVVGLAGLAAGLVALSWRPASAWAAAQQDWSPFVLVSGLLLIGLVADDDGAFRAAGSWLSSIDRGGLLVVGAAVLVTVTTAVLNLDTAVAFLTPVFVYTSRSRAPLRATLLTACILLANASSLFLPGSNLTNLIVLGQHPVTGTTFLSQMWLPALTAVLVTLGVLLIARRRSLVAAPAQSSPRERPMLGLGLGAALVAVVAVLTLPSPALVVAAVGAVAVSVRLLQRRVRRSRVAETLGLPVLVGLFGLAVALGTLGRSWSGPSALVSHLDAWGTAAVAAGAAVLANNLPAASLLAARPPAHVYSMLIGLNLGPNLFVTGSLAWVLWLRTARGAGAEPSIGLAARIGLIAVPLSIVASLGMLLLTGRS